MINSLTKEQTAKFPDYVRDWTNVGLSTDPASRPEAEQGVIESYNAVGLKAPRIVWCTSPMAQGIVRAILLSEKSASVWASVRDSVGDSVRDSVWASVRDSVRASVWASVGDSVRASVGDSV